MSDFDITWVKADIILNKSTTILYCDVMFYFIQICILLFVGIFAYYSYFHFDNLHFHVVRTYAWAGYDHAQHRVGQHYMLGEFIQGVREKEKQQNSLSLFSYKL